MKQIDEKGKPLTYWGGLYEDNIKKLAEEVYGKNVNPDYEEGYVDGYNKAKETLYTEEEVLQLLLRLQQTESYDNLYEWFKKFKKKEQ